MFIIWHCILQLKPTYYFFIKNFLFGYNPCSLNIGGRWSNLVVIFGFSNVRTIRITLNFNREREKVIFYWPVFFMKRHSNKMVDEQGHLLPELQDSEKNMSCVICTKKNLQLMFTGLYVVSVQIPMAVQSKACVWGPSLPGIAGWNSAGSMDICLLWVLCFVR
jgi:hypothetical protein